MNGTALCERVLCLRTGDDVEAADIVGRLEQAGLAGEEEDFQHVGRLGCAAGDVGIDRGIAPLLEQGRNFAEGLDDFLRFRRKRQVDRDQRPPLGQFLREKSKRWLADIPAVPVANARERKISSRRAARGALACCRMSSVIRCSPKTSTCRTRSRTRPDPHADTRDRHRSSAITARSFF